MFTKNQILDAGYTHQEYEAATRYIRRQAQEEWPKGVFDRAGRFFLAENLTCCCVRTPSRAHPYSELKHGCSIVHVAQLEGADLKAVRRLVSLLKRGATMSCPVELQKLLSKNGPPKRSAAAAAMPDATPPASSKGGEQNSDDSDPSTE